MRKLIYSFLFSENFRNFLELLLKATGEADIKKGPYLGPFSL